MQCICESWAWQWGHLLAVSFSWSAALLALFRPCPSLLYMTLVLRAAAQNDLFGRGCTR
jgi:hypothetical protein